MEGEKVNGLSFKKQNIETFLRHTAYRISASARNKNDFHVIGLEDCEVLSRVGMGNEIYFAVAELSHTSTDILTHSVLQHLLLESCHTIISQNLPATPN